MKKKEIKNIILQTLKEVIKKDKTLEEKRRDYTKDLYNFLLKQRRNKKTLSEVLEGTHTKYHPLLVKWMKRNLQDSILREQKDLSPLEPIKDLSATYNNISDVDIDKCWSYRCICR